MHAKLQVQSPSQCFRTLARAPKRAIGRQNTTIIHAGTVAAGDHVAVVGAAGGVGQILTAKLLERGYKVRAVVRNAEKAAQVFGSKNDDKLEVVTADLRDPAALKGLLDGCDAVCSSTGTTAFPSKRWDGDNGPEQTDWISNQNLIAATPRSIKRFVFTTSAGVERSGSFPFFILNIFGVLKYKRQAEELLEQSGLPWTIIRPSRLTDGPYTSYDLNTLLKATSGTRQDVQLSLRDDQVGEASRIAVAEAMLQALTAEAAEGKKFSLQSKEGEGPGQDQAAWQALFSGAA